MRNLAVLATVAGVSGLVSTCSPPTPTLEQVRQLGVLRVATINSPTTYYIGPTGETGFEFDLAHAFAQWLGVRLDLVLAESPGEVMQLVQTRRAHVGAAALAITEQRLEKVHFSPPVRTVTPQLVYRLGRPRPSRLDELGGRLLVPAGSSHAERLARMQRGNGTLAYEVSSQAESEELLLQVADGQLDYTVANSDLIAINQRYYPQLRVAMPLADEQPLAWAVRRSRDRSLNQTLAEFLQTLGDAELGRLQDRHFGHIARVDYVGAVALATHVETRLPRYRQRFRHAAERHGLDWRLLAAVGYQESHWDNAAVSPTGVRGIMQITNQTAEFLGISDRMDIDQTIEGAARYLRSLHLRLPESIPEPDRTWMMLAAYNIGLGHVLDARRLAEAAGGDPDRWVDVRARLPLLTQPRYYRQMRYGYARGHEAVTYVGNIRTFYDMLVWITGGPQPLPEPTVPMPEPLPLEEKDDRHDPLRIDVPVL